MTMYLTRLVLLRGMGVLYTAAFLTSALQSRALFGTQGLSPAPGLVASAAGSLSRHPRPLPAFVLLEVKYCPLCICICTATEDIVCSLFADVMSYFC